MFLRGHLHYSGIHVQCFKCSLHETDTGALDEMGCIHSHGSVSFRMSFTSRSIPLHFYGMRQCRKESES